jgi:molecular chaperone GrpE (heat shock protein)
MTTSGVFSFENFKSRYQFRILGRTDNVNAAVSQAFSDETRQGFVRNSRITFATAVRNLENSSLTQPEKNEQKLRANVNYAERVASNLRREEIKDVDVARKFANAINQTMTELRTSVRDYVTDQGVNADQGFLERVESLLNDFDRVMRDNRIQLRANGVLFDPNQNSAQKRALEIRELIRGTRLGGGGGGIPLPTTPPIPPDNSLPPAGSVDISV